MSNNNIKKLDNYVWNPTRWDVALSSIALNQFWYKANNTDIITKLTKGFTQPLDYVNSIKVYPFNVYDENRTETSSTYKIPIADVTIDVPINRTDYPLSESKVSQALEYIYKTYTFYFDKITDFTQVEPYTTITCFLPYVGFVNLSSSEIYGTIQVELYIDVFSGSGTYTISRDNYVIYTTQTNFAVDIALGGTNNIQLAKEQYSNAVNTLLGIGMTAIGVSNGNPFLTASGAKTTVNGLANIPQSNTAQVIKRGTLGNYPTSFNNPHSIYFIIKKKKISNYDNFKSYYGKPLNQEVELNVLEGMTFIPNPKLEIPNITTEEYDNLVDLLQDGVILSPIKHQLQVSKVSLNGSYDLYTKYQLSVSNVKLSGNYNLYTKDQLQVSNVTLNGSYDLYTKYQVSVSNVKLSGTYKYQGLEVSNVKMSGKYAIDPYANAYIKFESTNGYNFNFAFDKTNCNATLEYSLDGSTWNSYTSNTSITTNVIYLRGTGGTYACNTSTTASPFTLGASVLSQVPYIKVSGKLSALLDWQATDDITLATYAFYNLFYQKALITDASELDMSGFVLNTYAFYRMFRECTSLKTPPTSLPATTLAYGCYREMFYKCKSLTSAPELHATTLADSCCYYMFRECTSLKTPPTSLPATTLSPYCYDSMFYDCKSLTSAPALPATTLADNCYQYMFYDCTSLTSAPALPATTLKSKCYYSMFGLCTSLKLSITQTSEYKTAYRIPTSGTGTTATDALQSMFSNTGGSFKGTPTINTTYYGAW